MLTNLSHNLLKWEHHTGLKSWAGELRKLATANIDLHLALTNKSELNFKDKDVFVQVCTDAFLQATYLYTVWNAACIRVVWLSYSLGHVDHSAQSHTNSGFFKLTKALLQIYSYFFFTQYGTIRGLPLSAVLLSCCITCQHVCVQQSHAGLPFSDFK